jgi:hypothetical protein
VKDQGPSSSSASIYRSRLINDEKIQECAEAVQSPSAHATLPITACKHTIRLSQARDALLMDFTTSATLPHPPMHPRMKTPLQKGSACATLLEQPRGENSTRERHAIARSTVVCQPQKSDKHPERGRLASIPARCAKSTVSVYRALSVLPGNLCCGYMPCGLVLLHVSTHPSH